MELVRACLDEIALSGLEGCTLTELWSHLAAREDLETPEVDEITKSFLWNQVAQCACVSAYLLPEDKKAPPTLETLPISHSSEKWLVFAPSHEYQVVSEGAKSIRGASDSHGKRRPLSFEITQLPPNERTLEAVKRRYGERRVVLVGSPELRAHALIPADAVPCLSRLSDVQYCVLEVIGEARRHGIFRTLLTNKYLKNDPRSTFHHVKILKKFGLITTKVLHSYNKRVHVAFLTRFSPTHWQSRVNLRGKLFCQLLAKEPGKTALISVMKRKMGRATYASACAELLKSGYIEMVTVKKGMKAVHLVKPYAKESDTGEEEDGDKDEGEQEEEEEEEDEAYKDGEEEEDEEEVTTDHSYRVPVVGGLPLDVQGFRRIHDYGPQGITMPEFCRRGLTVDRNISRIIVTSLTKMESVVMVLMDNTGNKTRKVISSLHAHRSEDIKVLEEQKARSGVDVKLAIGTGREIFSERKKKGKIGDREDKEKKEIVSSTAIAGSSEYGGVGGMSLYQLTRLNIIKEYITQQRVVQGTADIVRFVHEEEAQQGKCKVAGHKTIKSLLREMEKRGLICSVTRELTSFDVTNEMTLFHLPDATESELEQSWTRAQEWLNSNACRRSKPISEAVDVKPRRPRRKRKRKKEDTSDEETEESEAEDVSESDEDTEISTNGATVLQTSMMTSKFQRLRHLHFYLWILTYGFESILSGEEEKEPFQLSDLLPEATFPWATGVWKQQESPKGPGWISYAAMLQKMPLALITILQKIPRGINHPKFRPYFTDPQHKNKLLGELPKSLCLKLTSGNRDIYHISFLLKKLVEMELIGIDPPLVHDCQKKVRKKMSIEVFRSANILDTRKALPRRTFFLNEARSMFSEIPCSFNSIADLVHYWYKLHEVCSATHIIIRAPLTSRSKRRRSANDQCKDIHPLPYKGMRSNKKEYEDFNGRGFGAGGLNPLMFSHLNRNWENTTSQFNFREQGSGPSRRGKQGDLPDGKAYGPGMGLFSIPEADMQWSTTQEQSSEPGEVSKQAGRSQPPPASKRPKLATVVVPTSEVKAHSGGKGYQRVRARKALQAARKAHTRTFYLTSLLTSKDIPEEGRISHSALARTRVVWYPHEDSFIMKAYTASQVLDQLGEGPVPVTLIRDALHKAFPSSLSKTSAAVRRRLFNIVKKKPDQGNVTMSVQDAIEKMALLGSSAPEKNFDSVFKFILQLSHDSQAILSASSLLPTSLEELHSSYQVVEDNLPDLQKEMDCTSVNKAILMQLILATLKADPKTYDPYSTFKAFEKYPEADLKAAFETLHGLQLIKVKRYSPGTPRTRGPMDMQTYELAAAFSQIVDGHFTPSFSQQLAVAVKDIRQFLCLPPNVETSGHGEDAALRLEPSSFNAGMLCAMCGLLTFAADEVCELVLPAQLFPTSKEETATEPQEQQQQQQQLMQSALDEHDSDSDDDMDGEDVRASKGSLRHAAMSTLLGFDESSPLQHGTVLVQPGVKMGPLLEPTDGEEARMDCDHESTVAPRDRGHVAQQGDDRLAWFLSIGSDRFSYTALEAELARRVYALVCESGTVGVTMETLQRTFESHHSLERVVGNLVNLELLVTVGIDVPRLVSHDNLGKWCVSIGGGDKEEGRRTRLVTPWISVTEEDHSIFLSQKLQQGVLSYVIRHPGTTMGSVLRQFVGLLCHNGLLMVIRCLEAGGCIRRYTLVRQRPTLYSSQGGTSFIRDARDDDDPHSVFLEATHSSESLWTEYLQSP